MAKQKKNRRSKSKPKVSESSTAAAAESKLSKGEQFRLEYAYVYKDLRTVFILAGVMFALLITLNLILQ